jgi:hypothetical protein
MFIYYFISQTRFLVSRDHSSFNRISRRLIIYDKISYKIIDKLWNKMTFVRVFLKIFIVLQYLFFAKIFGITK